MSEWAETLCAHLNLVSSSVGVDTKPYHTLPVVKVSDLHLSLLPPNLRSPPSPLPSLVPPSLPFFTLYSPLFPLPPYPLLSPFTLFFLSHPPSLSSHSASFPSSLSTLPLYVLPLFPLYLPPPTPSPSQDLAPSPLEISTALELPPFRLTPMDHPLTHTTIPRKPVTSHLRPITTLPEPTTFLPRATILPALTPPIAYFPSLLTPPSLPPQMRGLLLLRTRRPSPLVLIAPVPGCPLGPPSSLTPPRILPSVPILHITYPPPT